MSQEADAWTGKSLVARTTTHFLPKFDNQNADKRLAALLSGSGAEGASKGRGVLYVSKKHSGSLIMAPPFYSKNATANSFSRFGCVVLYEYFEAVWPGEGRTKFVEWWEDAEQSGICYSFECVTPRVLGDHGATPRCAYMVLTCAAVTNEERFMSPAELLQVATKWRLPLNEVWLIRGEKANDVERELHAKRWTLRDSDAGKLLDKYLEPGHQAQCFLPHGQTQGDVLEGFVLMALDADFDEMSGLVANYNATMAPHLDRALAAARQLGDRCLDPVQAKELLKIVEQKQIEPLNLPEVYHEPERLKSVMSPEAVWALACEQTQSNRLKMLFKRLHQLYGHSASLQPYNYRGRLQVQVHVRDDEVFYGWPLHTIDGSTAPLFRGMVVTLYPEGDPALSVHKPNRESAAPSVRIVGIAKLKCLNYMWRTFGVRNRIPILLKRGKDDYLKTLRKGFYPPWSIPKVYTEVLEAFFARWADFVLSLPAAKKNRLGERYLDQLEDFLAATPYPFSTVTDDGPVIPTSSSATVLGANVQPLSVIVCNLTGKADVGPRLSALGFKPDSNQLDTTACAGRHGTYELMPNPPPFRKAKLVDAVVALGPSEGDLAELDEASSKAIKGQFQGFRGNFARKFKQACKSTVLCTQPGTADDWLKAVEDFGKKTSVSVPASPSEENGAGAKAAAPESSAGKPIRVIVCTLGLPPGGGKSSLFHGLLDQFAGGATELADATFCFRSSDDFKGREPFEKALKRCIEAAPMRPSDARSPKGDPKPGAKVVAVGYDKNIPNMDGLQRLLVQLAPLAKNFDLRFVFVVPETIDHDKFWARVKARDPKTHIGLAIGPKLPEKKAYSVFKNNFFDSCEAFGPVAAGAPGAVVTDSFTRELPEDMATNPLVDLVKGIATALATGTAGAPFGEVQTWLDQNDTLLGGPEANGASMRSAPEKANWCSADIDGHPKLHVTLVPPPASKESRSDPLRQAALKKLQGVAGRGVTVYASKYHVATRVETADEGDGDGPSKKRSRQNSQDLARRHKRIAFWEVDRVEGLPDDLDLGKQFQILHITDRASMTRGVQAKNAAEVMAALRAQDATTWKVESESHPVTLDASISFYR